MNNTKNNNDNNENNMEMDDNNARNNNQQSFKPKHIKYFMILGPLLALAIIDAFDLYPKSNRIEHDGKFDETDRAFIAWMNELNDNESNDNRDSK